MMLSRSFDVSGIDHELKDLFLKQSTRTSYSDNGIIYLQEDSAEKLYLVVSGYVRLSYIMENGTTILYAIVPPGQSFGELGVFHQSVYVDTASAIGPVTVFSVRASLFHAETKHNSSFRNALSAIVADRYKTYIYVTKSLYFCNLSGRLAMSVLRLAQALAQTTEINGKNISIWGRWLRRAIWGPWRAALGETSIGF